MESFEMAKKGGNFTEPVRIPITAEQGPDQSGDYFASNVAESKTWLQVPEVSENAIYYFSEQLEDPGQACTELMHSKPMEISGLNEGHYSYDSETEEMLKLPRYISEALYVVDLHPLAIENVGYFLDLFSRAGRVSVVKVIPKPPGTPGIPLCSAYVNFHTVEDACYAWQTLNYHVWMGQPMRIMFSNLDPATRYNENANIIVTDLEESIGSKFLHQKFCKHGVVVSSKVEVDSNGKSTGRAFIQFEDEIDAKRAIEVMNNKKVRGKKVYVGPFIRRKSRYVHSQAEDMNKNPIDLNPAHNPQVEVPFPAQDLRIESFPIGKNGSRDILLGSSSNSGKESLDLRFGTLDSAHTSHEVCDEHGFLRLHGSSSGETTSNATVELSQGRREAKERERNLRRGTKASRNLARRKFLLGNYERGVQEMMKERMPSSQISVHLSKALSSKPWPPQPWSVKTLKDRLKKSHCPEERLAMLGATLFPMVARHTKTLVSDVTNVLVKFDMLEIERIMNLSEEALHQKVEEVKQDISERVPEFVPRTFFDVHEVEACEEKKHVIFVEEFKDFSLHVPAPALSTPAPTDPAPSVNFSSKEFVSPLFPVPIIPEFMQQAPALPRIDLGTPVTNTILPLGPLLLRQPSFPDSVMNYTGYRPGTGFYEPLVSHHLQGIYLMGAALAHAYPFHVDDAIAFEESANPLVQEELPVEHVKEVAHAERAQASKESSGLMEEVANAVRALVVEDFTDSIQEFASGERDLAMEEPADLSEEVANLDQANQAMEESDELMEEVASEEQAQAVEEIAGLMEAFAHVELDVAVEDRSPPII